MRRQGAHNHIPMQGKSNHDYNFHWILDSNVVSIQLRSKACNIPKMELSLKLEYNAAEWKSDMYGIRRLSTKLQILKVILRLREYGTGHGFSYSKINHDSIRSGKTLCSFGNWSNPLPLIILRCTRMVSMIFVFDNGMVTIKPSISCY